VGPASLGQPHLLARHELQRSMCADVNNGISHENVLQVGVQRHEPVMGRPTLGIEQSHWVAFVTESRLNTDEDVPQLNAENQKFAAASIDASRRGTPFKFYVAGIRTELQILIHAHAIRRVGNCSKLTRIALE